jgi:hypothetical protein
MVVLSCVAAPEGRGADGVDTRDYGLMGSVLMMVLGVNLVFVLRQHYESLCQVSVAFIALRIACKQRV